MVRHIFVVEQRDYDHHEDDAKVETYVNRAYATVKAANEAARMDMEEVMEGALDPDEEPEESTNADGGLELVCFPRTDDRDHVEISVRKIQFHGILAAEMEGIAAKHKLYALESAQSGGPASKKQKRGVEVDEEEVEDDDEEEDDGDDEDDDGEEEKEEELQLFKP
ncbi:hypothetical protein LTR56_000575 [Elasticomyces elasticus]|nr:hypothetical protein LTR56_000575 [Elasticomyces elasticus]KAK3664351.1 hypothetical protein LTR22_004764 [Elasticomyces elasticus]KAK4915461.1 hypothetical protein LTR49_016449 [Elasticomyces elasticus]KAK5752844.1 hypothetical protein LTS12_017123 [Elasticomyces elasticus]